MESLYSRRRAGADTVGDGDGDPLIFMSSYPINNNAKCFIRSMNDAKCVRREEKLRKCVIG